MQTNVDKYKLKTWNEKVKNRAEWEKSVKEATVRIGL